MKIKFTKSAHTTFLEALEYIHQNNPYAVEKFRQQAGKSLLRLKQFPESGRSLPEFPDLIYREVIVQSHRFFYRVAGNIILVVAVWHSAQQPELPNE
jgi:toxin ParE1/3/4